MIKVSQQILSQLEVILSQLSQEEYTSEVEIFSGASIAQHTRHILEFYVCLISTKNSDVINYDLRKRDQRIETDLVFCTQKIKEISVALNDLTEDRKICLHGVQGGENIQVDTTFKRELLYAVEHTVHHMAIIKMGVLLNFPKVNIPENFGVAESTIQYKNSCAQ